MGKMVEGEGGGSRVGLGGRPHRKVGREEEMCGFLSCLASVCCLLGVCPLLQEAHREETGHRTGGNCGREGRNKFLLLPCNIPAVRKKVEGLPGSLFTASQ